MIQQARHEKEINQEELADKCGTIKAYTSKIETNPKEVSLSILQEIIKPGLGEHIDLSIRL